MQKPSKYINDPFMIMLSLSRNRVDNNPNRCIMICLSSDDRSQINLFSSDNNEKFLFVSFIFFIYGSLNFSRKGQVIRK